jgi:hypothetical protein
MLEWLETEADILTWVIKCDISFFFKFDHETSAKS